MLYTPRTPECFVRLRDREYSAVPQLSPDELEGIVEYVESRHFAPNLDELSFIDDLLLPFELLEDKTPNREWRAIQRIRKAMAPLILSEFKKWEFLEVQPLPIADGTEI